MAHWQDRKAAASNLRLFEVGTGWRQHDDEKDEGGRITFVAAKGKSLGGRCEGVD